MLENLGRDRDNTELTLLPRQNIAQLTFPNGNPALALLVGLWTAVSIQPLSHDAGMMEEMMPLFRPGGRSYETRHFVTYESERNRAMISRTVAPFARIGSSGYFANVTGRGRSKELPGRQIYGPLHRSFVPTSHRRAFVTYVDDLILREMTYAMARLRANGIVLPRTAHADIDLAWMPPEVDGAFPIPVITEAFFEEGYT